VSAGVIRLDGIFKGNPFAGGEFDYLGFRVARMGRPVATQVETTTLNGRKALVLTEEAREMHFEERKIWLDPDSYVPLRAEYWRNGKKFLLAETEEIRDVQGVATQIRIRFSIPDRKDLTSVWQVDSIDYDRPILDSYFTPPG
jgi:hypothetical protein